MDHDDINTLTKRSNITFRTAIYMGLGGLFAVASMFGFQYGVNKNRSADHFVKYYEVRNVKSEYSIGELPEFFSKSEWFAQTDVAWPDQLHCVDLDNPSRHYLLDAEHGKRVIAKKPGRSGFYTKNGELHAGSRPGYWFWEGPIPTKASKCRLEGHLRLMPSPFVMIPHALPPTEWFYFR